MRVIGFQVKAVDRISQLTKHQQPHHHRKHFSQLCYVLNNCILTSLILAGGSTSNFETRCARLSKTTALLLHEPRRRIFPSLFRLVPVTAWPIGLRSGISHYRWTEPRYGVRELRLLQAQGAEALTVQGHVGQPLSRWLWIKTSEHAPCEICQNH